MCDGELCSVLQIHKEFECLHDNSYIGYCVLCGKTYYVANNKIEQEVFFKEVN